MSHSSKSENRLHIPPLKASQGFCSGQAININDVVLPDKSDIYLLNLTDTKILLSSLQSSEHLAMVFPLPRLLKFPCMMLQSPVLQLGWQLTTGKTRRKYLAFTGISMINKKSEVTDFPRRTGQRDVFPLKKTLSL